MEMEQAVLACAPVLPPLLMPKAVNLYLDNLLLVSEVQDALKLKPQMGACNKCEICGIIGDLNPSLNLAHFQAQLNKELEGQTNQKQIFLSPQWDFDINEKAAALKGIETLCTFCQLLKSPKEVLQLVSSLNPKVISKALDHFANVNQHVNENQSAMAAFQECYSLGYSLSIIYNNIKTPKVANSKGDHLTAKYFSQLIRTKLQGNQKKEKQNQKSSNDSQDQKSNGNQNSENPKSKKNQNGEQKPKDHQNQNQQQKQKPNQNQKSNQDKSQANPKEQKSKNKGNTKQQPENSKPIESQKPHKEFKKEKELPSADKKDTEKTVQKATNEENHQHQKKDQKEKQKVKKEGDHKEKNKGFISQKGKEKERPIEPKKQFESANPNQKRKEFPGQQTGENQNKIKKQKNH